MDVRRVEPDPPSFVRVRLLVCVEESVLGPDLDHTSD